jgi:hypothetical protein
MDDFISLLSPNQFLPKATALLFMSRADLVASRATVLHTRFAHFGLRIYAVTTQQKGQDIEPWDTYEI